MKAHNFGRRREDLTGVPPWRIRLPDAACLRKVYVFRLLNTLNWRSSTPSIEHVNQVDFFQVENTSLQRDIGRQAVSLHVTYIEMGYPRRDPGACINLSKVCTVDRVLGHTIYLGLSDCA